MFASRGRRLPVIPPGRRKTSTVEPLLLGVLHVVARDRSECRGQPVRGADGPIGQRVGFAVSWRRAPRTMALGTGTVKTQIEFFTDVLRMEREPCDL
jgi:hypothetical protein